MFRSPSRTSAKTGVAPAWTITFAVAGQVIGVVITSSPGPDAERDAARGAAPPSRTRPPARASPRRTRRSAARARPPAARSSASRSGASRRPRRSPRRRPPAAGSRGRSACASSDDSFGMGIGCDRSVCSSAARPARSSASSRESRRRRAPRRRGRRRGAAAPKHVRPARGRSRTQTTPSSARPPRRPRPPRAARRARGRGSGRTRRPPRVADAAARRSTGSPSAAASGEAVQVDAERGLAELRVVPAAEPRRELDDARARRSPTSDLRVGRPVRDRRAPPRPPRRARRPPRRSASARASSARRARARRRTRAARRRRRSVTVSGWNRPSTENAFTVTSRPGDELLDEDDARRATRRARASNAVRELVGSSRRATSPFWPCRSGALTTHG